MRNQYDNRWQSIRHLFVYHLWFDTIHYLKDKYVIDIANKLCTSKTCITKKNNRNIYMFSISYMFWRGKNVQQHDGPSVFFIKNHNIYYNRQVHIWYAKITKQKLKKKISPPPFFWRWKLQNHLGDNIILLGRILAPCLRWHW